MYVFSYTRLECTRILPTISTSQQSVPRETASGTQEDKKINTKCIFIFIIINVRYVRVSAELIKPTYATVTTFWGEGGRGAAQLIKKNRSSRVRTIYTVVLLNRKRLLFLFDYYILFTRVSQSCGSPPGLRVHRPFVMLHTHTQTPVRTHSYTIN